MLLLAAAVLFAGSGCMLPVALHDGLPAWAPAPNGIEWRAGYHHLSAFGADSFNFLGQQFRAAAFDVGYLTPGMRVGLNRAPLAAELGFTSAIKTTGGFSALLGGEVGLGYNDAKISVMFRPSFYLLDFYSDRESGTGVDVDLWPQASLLVGNGYRPRGLNFALGGRASQYGAGPVAVVGYNLQTAEVRAEVSYMLPTLALYPFVRGKALTIGVTVAAPSKPGTGHR